MSKGLAIFTLIGVLCFSPSAEAQRLKTALSLGTTFNTWRVSNTEFGPEINRNTIGISGEAAPEEANYEYAWGIDVGVAWQYEIDEPVFIESGLFFSQKNISAQINRESLFLTENIDLEMSTYLLRIPLHVGYTFALGKNHKVKPFIGAYGALGLGGDYSANVEVVAYSGDNEEIQSRTVNGQISYTAGINQENATVYAISNSYYLNRLDLGLDIGVNYQYKKVGMALCYSLGLVDTDPAILLNIVDDTVTNRFNRTLIVSLQYFF